MSFQEGALEVAGYTRTISLSTSVLGALLAVRDLLAEPRRRVTGVLATNEFGVECDPKSKTATCWCLMGALLLVRDRDVQHDATRLIRNAGGNWLLNEINDNFSHAEVIATLNTAIEKARRAK